MKVKDTYSYNIILRSICVEKKVEALTEILLEMENSKVRKDLVTYNTLGEFYAING